MINLIKRDAIIQKNQLLIFIPFILFFVFMDTHPVIIFLVASIFIPFNAFAYDEQAETNILLNSLPYTRKEIIAARYLGALVYMLLSVALTAITLLIFNKPFTMEQIGFGISMFVLFAACSFPLFNILKQGYISLVLLISFLFLVGIVPKWVDKLLPHIPTIINFITNLSNLVLYGSVLLFTLILYIVSWMLSTYLYQRKTF
ncbi:ABC-2 transporter permease [Pseudogracilibacillus sp. ICA-222130]|uniref:ABC-2 transporter permease n=1 Tax=Pseudogracilibacillus sp. ICA-222130 TaxID=3134655 RepID=UPI0030BBEB0B